jgi:hypothetical protein
LPNPETSAKAALKMFDESGRMVADKSRANNSSERMALALCEVCDIDESTAAAAL